MKEREHEKISPTAKVVAYLRTFSDIPYSKEISVRTGSQEVLDKLFSDQRQLMLSRMPILEARFKALSRLMDKAGNKNILEIAAGISPRGLIYTDDSKIQYIETDLNPLLSEKERVVHTILKDNNLKRDNLRFIEANALDEKQLEKAVSILNGSVTICQEGLMLYLSKAEQSIVAENVKKILSKRKGSWVTDISLKSEFAPTSTERRKVVEAANKETGSSFIDNAFEDDTAVKDFFTTHGFKIEQKLNLKDLIYELTGIVKLGLEQNAVTKLLETRNVYLLTLN